MTRHFNSASRVCTILQKAAVFKTQNLNVGGFGFGANSRAVDVWSTVFGFPAESSVERNLQVGAMLKVLHNEIELAYQTVKATVSVSPELYEDAYQNARTCASVDNLSQAWDTQVQLLSAETLRALGFCAEIVPDEEQPINPEELASLAQQVEELRSAVINGALPNDAKAFLLNQILIIEDAIRKYPLQGGRAFGSGMAEAVAEMARHENIVKQNSRSEEFNSLRKVWNFIREKNTDVDVIMKVLAGGATIAGIAGKLIGS